MTARMLLGPQSRHRVARHVRLGLVGAALLSAFAASGGCSWSRFDDVQENAPVLLLKKPDKLKAGFGISVSAAASGDNARILVAGAANRSRGAAYSVLKNQDAKIDATDTGYCSTDSDANPCLMASSTAALGLARVPGGTTGTLLDLCFVIGVGQAANGAGLLARCRDQTEYALPVPASVDNVVVRPALTGEEGTTLYLAADKDELASVIAGAPAQTPPLAWFYPPDSMTPMELIPSSNDPSYGSAVASIRVAGGGRVLAVGAPAEDNVYLFRWAPGDAEATLVGCLGGLPSFGRALVSGRVNGDEVDELVVSDERTVHVIDGAALAALPPTQTPVCSLASLPAEALIASFGCGTEASVAGCASSQFGAALEVADLDADGDGEVLVGAPLMNVRDTDGAGAVLVYDAEGERPFVLSDILFISSAEEGDQLGRSLAVARSGTQEFVVAGAPGNEKTALMFCSTFSTGLAPRCN